MPQAKRHSACSRAVTIRLTQAQREALAAYAEQRGMKLATAARQLVVTGLSAEGGETGAIVPVAPAVPGGYGGSGLDEQLAVLQEESDDQAISLRRELDLARAFLDRYVRDFEATRAAVLQWAVHTGTAPPSGLLDPGIIVQLLGQLAKLSGTAVRNANSQYATSREVEATLRRFGEACIASFRRVLTDEVGCSPEDVDRYAEAFGQRVGEAFGQASQGE